MTTVEPRKPDGSLKALSWSVPKLCDVAQAGPPSLSDGYGCEREGASAHADPESAAIGGQGQVQTTVCCDEYSIKMSIVQLRYPNCTATPLQTVRTILASGKIFSRTARAPTRGLVALSIQAHLRKESSMDRVLLQRKILRACSTVSEARMHS